MISVGFERVSKNVRVGFAVNPLIVAFRETKVLPSASESGARVPQRRKHTRPLRNSIHHDSANNQEIEAKSIPMSSLKKFMPLLVVPYKDARNRAG